MILTLYFLVWIQSSQQSFLVVNLVIGSILELITLIIGHQLFDYQSVSHQPYHSLPTKEKKKLTQGFRPHFPNHSVIPSGPFLITFAILYQHQRTVPALYHYVLKPITFDSHTLSPHLLALALFCLNPVSASLGLLTGALYRSHQLGLHQWRLSPRLLPPSTPSSSSARRPTHARLEDDPALGLRHTSSGQVSQTPEAVQPPSEEVLASLTAMFPGRSRDELLSAWNASRGNLATAVDVILRLS